MKIDLLVTNANILTMDDNQPTASSVGVLGGRIVAVGPDTEGLDARRTVDLGGKTLVPGFHDAHNHMVGYGMALDEIDLRAPAVNSLDELYDAVAARAADTPAGSWIVGSGYDQNKLGAQHPHRDVLDRIAPDHLVWLKHTSGHMCVVNGKVLDSVDLDSVPPGGAIVRDSSGVPTGLLQEQAQGLVRTLVFPYSQATLVDTISRASAVYATQGLVGLTEAGIGGGWVGNSTVEFAAYQAARDSGALLQRTTLMIVSDSLHPLDRNVEDGPAYGLELGIRTGLGDDRLRIGAMKVFSDGSLIGHTAAMCHDFSNDPGNVGFLQDEVDHMRSVITGAHLAGWQVATHAIGDKAVGTVLDIYEEVLSKYPRANHRHRIEHTGVCPPADVERIARLGVIPVPQGRFIEELGDGMADALGPERTEWCYRFKGFLDAGITVPGSSDRPVVQGAPLLGMQSMVTRRTRSGAVFGAAERVSALEALRCYTMGSAYASFREDSTGSITPGKLADFVVLAEDPTAIDPEGIGSIDVLATVIGGDTVYGSL
ncbi:hypothetical protein CLV47_10992 [Antricoccus suffuscus]|uniref:Amidohydrolase 3 domain-containing protein n=1 Tax=Antricoccus suffuscus TaxID=1629062 RepID=A0A2T0ZYW3_9ACTN|nr:amidohydrolase [Antricoccus suffuscus]PRZ41545.1 hypothetical protein CLV47_10992 [Antricoccus suffuscus]